MFLGGWLKLTAQMAPLASTPSFAGLCLPKHHLLYAVFQAKALQNGVKIIFAISINCSSNFLGGWLKLTAQMAPLAST